MCGSELFDFCTMTVLPYDVQCTKRALMHFAYNIGPDHHVQICSLIGFSVSTDSVSGQ